MWKLKDEIQSTESSKSVIIEDFFIEIFLLNLIHVFEETKVSKIKKLFEFDFQLSKKFKSWVWFDFRFQLSDTPKYLLNVISYIKMFDVDFCAEWCRFCATSQPHINTYCGPHIHCLYPTDYYSRLYYVTV